MVIVFISISISCLGFGYLDDFMKNLFGDKYWVFWLILELCLKLNVLFLLC